MRKAYAYLLGGSIIISTAFITQACHKNGSTDSDLLGNWTRASDFDGNGRSEAVSFVIGTFAYIATGTTDRDRFSDLWEYSLEKKFWSQKANLPGVPRNSGVGFAIGTKGYVGTGYDGVNYLKDFWEFDPATNTWLQKDDFTGTARYDANGFAIGNNGFVTCGYDGNYLKDLWSFDPNGATGAQWIQKSSIDGTKRSAATSFVIADKAYIVSGNNNGEILKDMFMYDPTADVWTAKRNIYNYSDDNYDDNYTSIPRQNGVAFVIGNDAYISTGENGSITSSTWQYVPSTDLWLQKTIFEGTGRTGAIAFSLDNRGFILTGRSGALSLDNGYELHPNDVKVDGD